MAAVDDGQRLTVELTKAEGEHLFAADTIGGVLANTDKALKATAKHLGGKVTVFIADIRIDAENGKLAFDLVIAENKPKAKKSKQEAP